MKNNKEKRFILHVFLAEQEPFTGVNGETISYTKCYIMKDKISNDSEHGIGISTKNSVEEAFKGAIDSLIKNNNNILSWSV